MPTTKSAKKRLRQNLARRARNRSVKSAMRTQMRKVRDAVREGNIERAEAELHLAMRKLDKSAARHALHPNTAARYKSRLHRLVAKTKAATGPSPSPPANA